jgi:TonB family protein
MRYRLLPFVAVLGLFAMGPHQAPFLRAQANATSAARQNQAPELAEAERLWLQIVVLDQQGKFAEALPLAQRMLSLREKALGSDHILIADSLISLADLYLLLGKKTQARESYRKAIAIYDKQSGLGNKELANILERYACLLAGASDDEFGAVRRRLFRLRNGVEYKDSRYKALKMAMPQPLNSKQLNGTVVARITVDETGRVSNLAILCGEPIFQETITRALRESRFQPAIVSGARIKVVDIINYQFHTW